MATNRRPPTAEELQAGDFLGKAIEKAGFTHLTLATALKVSPGLISQWVNAFVRLPISRAERVAELLGVAPGYICVKYRSLRGSSHRLDVKEPRAAYEVQHQAVRKIAAMISSGDLSPSQVELLLKTAEAFAQATRLAKKAVVPPAKLRA